MPSKSEKEIAELQQQIEELGSRIAALAAGAVEAANDMGKEKMAEAVDMASDVAKKAKREVEKADSYVKQNPWQVVLGAAAIGILVGAMLRNKAE